MNTPETNRPRESTRALLQRGQSFRTRALPPLGQIKRSVDNIMSHWPDAVRTPEDRDREKLAQNMRLRVSKWNWENTTTQRVISAAVAVFDKERCNRPDLRDVREFYVDEIATREPGAFLDGMVGVYLDSFTVGADHTRDLARSLSARGSDLGGRHRKLIIALPQVFTPDAAPRGLAQLMLETDDAYAKLQSIGLSSPHTSGLAKAAQKLFVKSLAPDLANTSARQKLLNWLTPQTGPVLQTGAGPAVEALLSVWRTQTPPDALRNELSEAIIAAWNDPRLHAGGIWSGFDPDLRAILLRWLTHQDMKFFCNMVTATQNNHMWPPRRDFWLQLFDDNMIDEAWVAFGSAARRYAQQNLIRQGDASMNTRFGRQLDRGGNTSLLIMRIGNKIVVDGCHNYRTHIFRIDDPKAPKLYDNFQPYYCDRIMHAATNSRSHHPIPRWKEWVLKHV